MLNSKVPESLSFSSRNRLMTWGERAPGGEGLELKNRKPSGRRDYIDFQSKSDILAAAARIERTVCYVGPTVLQLVKYFSLGLQFESHEDERPFCSLPT